MHKHDTQYKPLIYQSKRRGQNRHATMLKMTIRQEIDHLVETEIHLTEAEEILVEILDNIIEEDHKTIIEMTIDKTIREETTEETIYREQKYRNKSGSRDNCRDIYRNRENSRQDYSQE